MDELTEILAKIDDGASKGNREMVLVKARHLSPDIETAPFLLYLMGDSIEQISDKTKYPKEIIAVTARHYGWVEKREAFNKQGRSVPNEIQRHLVNTILATTYMAIQQEMAMVLRGERDPSQTKFIPKSINALQTLIQMVNTVNQIETKNPSMPPIKGENIQVNILQGDNPLSKADILKRLADTTDIITKE
ncbi:hypothetical protein UFOVP244_81 [uncultured Caudovirales phage]|uniref:Uncharacterized protein n=1 Tax=uncultured Caudovirales phage TaxID=2100421 RepID=A0A6J7WYE4_9CAUD|nr:hypothetical protein UFOVP244_81 [uncultured Caudovirales phage]